MQREELLQLTLRAERRRVTECTAQSCRERHRPWTLVPRHVAQARCDLPLQGGLQRRGVRLDAAVVRKALLREPLTELRER